MKPRVVILADVRTWAWHKKATALKACLSDRFDIEIVYSSEDASTREITLGRYDLLHTFEIGQAVRYVPSERIPFVTGLTAHVWKGWEKQHGPAAVKSRAKQARGFHANSRLLQTEVASHLGRDIFYVPNGVDADFYQRTRPRESGKMIVGWVGKPNPRKGHEIVVEACKKVGVELRAVCRRSGDALTAEDMREFYQGIHVLAVASDMDGTPNPALEAAACECAIVSNKIGNMPEFIEPGVNGMFHDRSVAQLSEALWSLAQNPIEEVEEMGRAARRTVEREWTWKIQAENYAAMWSACIGGRA